MQRYFSRYYDKMKVTKIEKEDAIPLHSRQRCKKNAYRWQWMLCIWMGNFFLIRIRKDKNITQRKWGRESLFNCFANWYRNTHYDTLRRVTYIFTVYSGRRRAKRSSESLYVVPIKSVVSDIILIHIHVKACMNMLQYWNVQRGSSLTPGAIEQIRKLNLAQVDLLDTFPCDGKEAKIYEISSQSWRHTQWNDLQWSGPKVSLAVRVRDS